jgi:hypothetical protein
LHLEIVEGQMTSRSPTATLSRFELTALRRIADGRPADVEAGHLKVLLTMGLAVLDENGGMALTADGQQRLHTAHDQANR